MTGSGSPPAGGPFFVISLDFELMWGVRDKRTVQSYGGEHPGRARSRAGHAEALPGIPGQGHLGHRGPAHVRRPARGPVEGPPRPAAHLPAGRARSLRVPCGDRRRRGRGPLPLRPVPGAPDRGTARGWRSEATPSPTTTAWRPARTGTSSGRTWRLPSPPSSAWRPGRRAWSFPATSATGATWRSAASSGSRSFAATSGRGCTAKPPMPASPLLKRGVRLLDHYLPLSGSNGFQPSVEAGLVKLPGQPVSSVPSRSASPARRGSGRGGSRGPWRRPPGPGWASTSGGIPTTSAGTCPGTSRCSRSCLRCHAALRDAHGRASPDHGGGGPATCRMAHSFFPRRPRPAPVRELMEFYVLTPAPSLKCQAARCPHRAIPHNLAIEASMNQRYSF